MIRHRLQRAGCAPEPGRWRVPLIKSVAVGLVTVGLLTLGGVGGTSAASATAPLPATVPVTVLGGQGTTQGARPTVEVRVGNSNPVPVLLDTGSSGLHIFDTAVNTGTGSGVTLSSQPSNITYSGGHRFTGVVANAVVTIGSYATKMPVSFAYVERAFCIASKPTCPASGGIPGFEQSGAYGILGIGTQSSGGGIISPILGMPGSLGKKWSLHLAGGSGTLTLGARLPAARSATTIQMRQIGSSAGSGLWADTSLPLCLSVGQDSDCVPGLFDSGTYTMQISGPGWVKHRRSQEPITSWLGHRSRSLSSGANTPFWTFMAGTTKSADLVTVKTGQGPFVNTGVQAFYDFTITTTMLRVRCVYRANFLDANTSGPAIDVKSPPRTFDAKGNRLMPDESVSDSGSSIDNRHLLLVGAGPGLGMAVARRFADGGYRVTLVARSTDGLSDLADSLADTGAQIHTIVAGASDPEALGARMAEIYTEQGAPGLIITTQSWELRTRS